MSSFGTSIRYNERRLRVKKFLLQKLFAPNQFFEIFSFPENPPKQMGETFFEECTCSISVRYLPTIFARPVEFEKTLYVLDNYKFWPQNIFTTGPWRIVLRYGHLQPSFPSIDGRGHPLKSAGHSSRGAKRGPKTTSQHFWAVSPTPGTDVSIQFSLSFIVYYYYY